MLRFAQYYEIKNTQLSRKYHGAEDDLVTFAVAMELGSGKAPWATPSVHRMTPCPARMT